MGRDEKGRFLPGHSGRPPRQAPAPETTIVNVRVTGLEAEMAHAAARRRSTTLSALLRAFVRRLIAEQSHRIR